ncbi:MAG: STAS/SEC14 domain-containing protein [Hyphomicrobiaceae bacterium]
MITLMEGYPDDVLAISGTGHVTAEDYHRVLVPEAEARIARNGSISVLFLLGDGFAGYSPGAIWADTEFGLGHLSAFDRVALVTDTKWIAEAARIFSPLFRKPFRIFPAADLAKARNWILANRGST